MVTEKMYPQIDSSYRAADTVTVENNPSRLLPFKSFLLFTISTLSRYLPRRQHSYIAHVEKISGLLGVTILLRWRSSSLYTVSSTAILKFRSHCMARMIIMTTDYGYAAGTRDVYLARLAYLEAVHATHVYESISSTYSAGISSIA